MIIFTPKQREQLAKFLTENGKDHDCYFVGEDGWLYMRLPSPQEPVLVPDEEMLDIALARAGLAFKQGMVENGLVSMYGINSDISSQNILLETMSRVERVLPINMADQFEMAWFRIFSCFEADGQEVPDSALERIASGVENLPS